MDDHMDVHMDTDGCLMAQVEVITGRDRRRSYTDEQKQAFLAEAFSPGTCVKDVVRRHDIPASSLYNWRRQFMGPLPPKKAGSSLTEASVNAFMPVVSTPETEQGAIEIAIGSSRVRIPVSTTPELAAAIVGALVRK